MNFFLKLFFELVNLFCNNRAAFALAKKLKLFDAIFVMYPANSEFADYFTFRFRQWVIIWRPFILGVIKHPSGKRTLKFAISAFVDQRDGIIEAEMLRMLHVRVELIGRQLGAKTIHFAGTLPGRFSLLRVNRGENQKNERKATQENVLKAVILLRKKLLHDATHPVVVLGSKGYIGKGVTEQLKASSVPVIEVDKDSPLDGRYLKPHSPHIIVNLTAPEALNEYVGPKHMDHTTTVLNEVYPSPHPDVVKYMKILDVRVFHIAGVIADVFPKFPNSYQGAVPCCAALHGEDYEVKVIEL